jgi:hypothetical protein
MHKKAMEFSKLVALIIAAVVILAMFVIALLPLISKGKLFFQTYGGKCKETGLTMDDYQLEIETLITNFDITGRSYRNPQEMEGKKEEIAGLYGEFIECFPDNNLEAYMEGLDEAEVFNFIFIMKEQEHYDETSVNIAKRYLRRFPGMHTAEVNQYINAAEAAT